MNELKFNGLGAMLEWKYGLVANTKQVGDKMIITSWRHATIPQPDEYQLTQDMKEWEDYLLSIAYKEKRRKEYPEIGDQLDSIVKTLNYISKKGVDIGTYGDNLISQIESIKKRYPKI